MNVLSLDTETTNFNKGAPYDSRNKLVCYSYAYDDVADARQWNEDAMLDLNYTLDTFRKAQLIVGFNFKFDYHWLTKKGVDLSKSTIWDVQLAEFILSHQKNVMPSLNETCQRYGIEQKLDVVKTEYWDKGIQTDMVPWPILREYAAHDAKGTLQCYHAQRKLMSPKQVRLCQLMCQDLHILQSMEANGLPFDEKLCAERAQEVDDQISKIKLKLSAVYPHVPVSFSSNDHLSAFLYGGVVKEEGKEHIGFYKTGEKKGQPYYKNVIIEHQLPRLFVPLKGSELLKEGMYATDESTLRKLKGKKSLINLILELSKLEKLNGTYYKGLVKLREIMHWPEGLLHGQFNQCVAQTGRLSSSKPNLQNFASELQDVFVSKYDD